MPLTSFSGIGNQRLRLPTWKLRILFSHRPHLFQQRTFIFLPHFKWLFFLNALIIFNLRTEPYVTVLGCWILRFHTIPCSSRIHFDGKCIQANEKGKNESRLLILTRLESLRCKWYSRYSGTAQVVQMHSELNFPIRVSFNGFTRTGLWNQSELTRIIWLKYSIEDPKRTKSHLRFKIKNGFIVGRRKKVLEL